MSTDYRKIYSEMTKEEKSLIDALHKSAQECVEYLDALGEKKERYKDYPAVIKLINRAIKETNATLEQFEFAMQEVWGFKQDACYHTWWLYPKYCECPKMDNRDPVFYGAGKIIVECCPIHGELYK